MRNLASTVTEEILEKAFSQFGKLERVKKLKDYAFIHFEERDGAVKVQSEKSFHIPDMSVSFFDTVTAGSTVIECRLTLIILTGAG